jgi:hypothetical protein
MSRLLLTLLLLAPSMAVAFERTPETFRLTHGKAYGPWEVICGHFGAEANVTCDLRYTDIYSPRPDFRAWLLFLQNSRDADDRPGPVELQLRMEGQSSLVGGGFTGPGGFNLGLSDCLLRGCTLTGERMDRLVEAMRRSPEVTLTFFDYGVQRQERVVPTASFAAAWADFAAQRQARGLP